MSATVALPSTNNSIKARKRRRAQIRRQAYERSLVDQVAPDNDDLYARKKQATDECASLVVDSLDSPHQGQDAAALIGKTSNEGLFEETDNDTSNRPDQRSRALEDAISSLSEKLERILPAGSRPSDIRAELTSRAQGASSLSTTIQEAQLSQTASDNGDLVLSQTQHSQQSVSLWDDIQEIFHALLSKVPELERQVRGLTATPSRLLLDAIQSAARLHARAVVDGILLPLTEQNESTLTKVHTELIFNVLKSQAPTTLVHFLGEWLTSLTNPGTQKERHEQQQQYDIFADSTPVLADASIIVIFDDRKPFKNSASRSTLFIICSNLFIFRHSNLIATVDYLASNTE
ncbi:hypothetical protein BGW42_004052 [Actinomortierella wolfii]|nr:hypothetical protein BGW42_004052 [Actinomortierella wolfii]